MCLMAGECRWVFNIFTEAEQPHVLQLSASHAANPLRATFCLWGVLFFLPSDAALSTPCLWQVALKSCLTIASSHSTCFYERSWAKTPRYCFICLLCIASCLWFLWGDHFVLLPLNYNPTNPPKQFCDLVILFYYYYYYFLSLLWWFCQLSEPLVIFSGWAM